VKALAHQGLLCNGGGNLCVMLYTTTNDSDYSSVNWTVTGHKLNGRDSVTSSGKNFLFVINYGMSVGPKIPPTFGTQGSFLWSKITEALKCCGKHGV